MVREVRKLAVGVMVALVFGVSAGANADAGREGLTLSAHVGQSQFDDLDNEAHVQLGVGWKFKGPWSVEAVYASLDSSGGTPEIDVEVVRWHVDAQYRIETSAQKNNPFANPKLQPYLLGGIGYASTNFTNSEGGFDNDDRMLNIGGGVKYDLGSGWSVRGEARIFKVQDIDELRSVFNIGLEYMIHPAAAK